ncbi:MAG: NAD-dependent epimerase/dehydratase family protein [Gemmataceae bacterium]
MNFEGTVNVLRTAVEAGCRRVLHTSTESILTRGCQAEPIREDQAVPPDDVIGPYRRSMPGRTVCVCPGARLPVVIVNPTLPVGPGDRGRSPPTQIDARLLPRPTPRVSGRRAEPDRRPRRRRRHDPGDGGRPAGGALSARA